MADLPESYEDAKSAIHAAFPSIYDTKFMTFEVRKLLDQNELFKWAGLSPHLLSYLSRLIQFIAFSDVLASTNLEDLTTFMRPKRGPSDLGLQVQHCPEMFVAGDEFARYGECVPCPPISPSLHSFGKEQIHCLSVPIYYDPLPFPFVNAIFLVLDLSRADAKFFHEAGFDAYVTGYCFVMTAHLAASVNYL